MILSYLGYTLDELLLLFAIYSVLGWFVDICIYKLVEGKFDNRGICKGPYAASFGIGAILILQCVRYVPKSISSIFGIGVMIGLIIQLMAALFIRILSGHWLVSHKWYYLPLFGFSSIIMFYHLNPIIIAIISTLSPWINMILLLAFWMKFVPELFDGVGKMLKFKKSMRTI